MTPHDLLLLCRSCAENIHGNRPPNHQYASRITHLLIGTAATESHLKYRRQRGFKLDSDHGAWGLWQTEIPPLTDSVNYLKRNTAVRENAAQWLLGHDRREMDGILGMGGHGMVRLIHDWDRFAVLMARIHYMRFPEPIPYGLDAQAWYWKKYYNTHMGRGTPEKYRDDWRRLVSPLLED